jgi:hypothetical protein
MGAPRAPIAVVVNLVPDRLSVTEPVLWLRGACGASYDVGRRPGEEVVLLKGIKDTESGLADVFDRDLAQQFAFTESVILVDALLRFVDQGVVATRSRLHRGCRVQPRCRAAASVTPRQTSCGTSADFTGPLRRVRKVIGLVLIGAGCEAGEVLLQSNAQFAARHRL